jgi:hypothetical protein
MVVENPGLVDRQLPAVADVLVVAGERLRQPGQPLVGEPVDLLMGKARLRFAGLPRRR